MTRRGKAACPQGHTYPENLRPRGNGCKICHREQERARNHAKGVKPRTTGLKAGVCGRGHKLTPQNLRSKGKDKPECRKCHQINNMSSHADVRDYAAILIEDPCSYCGGPGGCVDHIVPKARGGPDSPDNLTSACFSCNARKRTKSLLIFLLHMKLGKTGLRSPQVHGNRKARGSAA